MANRLRKVDVGAPQDGAVRQIELLCAALTPAESPGLGSPVKRPADRRGCRARFQQVIDTNAVVIDRTVYSGPTGETRHYECIFVPIFASDGQIEGVAGSTRDTTEIEQALAASELKLQQVFAHAPVAIVAFRGKHLVVELANPPYLSLLPGRELLGRPFGDAVPELGQEVWDVLRGVLNTGEPVYRKRVARFLQPGRRWCAGGSLV